MNFSRFEAKSFALRLITRSSIGRGAAVLLGAIMLYWPALFNGFPLLYPDSMTYIGDGRVVARAVFLHQFADYYGVRSFFYSLGILPFHWNQTLWPVAALQCLLVAWVIWLLVRSFAPRRTVASYVCLMLFLSLLTSASWYSDFIMPDILGPLVYLAFYLLVFARQTLSRTEHIALCLVAVWGVTAHSSHLVLAGGLFLLLILYTAFQGKPFGKLFLGRLWKLRDVAVILALAMAAQMALHGYLYGKPSLNGERPPFLMSRTIADGPGKWYLEKNCSHLQWTVCKHLSQLNDDPDFFLWDENGVYQSSSDSDQRKLNAEEIPMVLATLRAYPYQQFSRSMANFGNQLINFGPYGFDPNAWMLGQFDEVLPNAKASYLESRQAHGALPLEVLAEIERWAIIGSLAVIVALIPLLWRRHSPGLPGLALVIGSIVIANALVTGVLSVVDDRYQCRVIWLIPFLAGIFFLDWLQQRGAAKAV